MEQGSREHAGQVLCHVTTRAERLSATKGSPAWALRQLVCSLGESVRSEGPSILAPGGPVKVQHPKRDHNPVTLAEELATNDSIGFDEPGGHCV